MIRFSCPKCETSLKTADEKAGTKLLCPDCGEKVEVPSESSEKNGKSSTKTATLPKKTTAKTATGGSSKGLFVGLAVGACVLVAGGAGVAIWAMQDKPKTEVKNTTPTPTESPIPSPSVASAPTPSVFPTAPGVTPTTIPESPLTPPVAVNPTPTIAFPGVKPGESNQAAKADPQTKDPALPQIASLEGEAAYNRLLKSTCWVFTETSDKMQGGTGSGALIDRENRLVLTAYHVVDIADNGKGRIFVSFPVYDKGRVLADKATYRKLIDRKEALSAWIEFVDKKKDLAILKLPEITEGVQPLRLARGSVVPGQRVHSLGNPGASDGMWIYSPGNVRQVFQDSWVIGGGPGKEPTKYSARVIEAASPVNPGDSGGPMINEQKELVGVAHAVNTRAALMAMFIDIESVREFLEVYYKSKGLKKTILDEAPAADKNEEIPVLIRKLEAPDANTRARAAEVLSRIGRDAKPAINPLLKALKDKDENVRRNAAEALEQIGGLTQRHLSGLTEALKDESPDVRLGVIAVLKLMGGEAESATPALTELIKNEKDPMVRRKAAAALGAIGADPKTALPLLMASLKDPSGDVRSAAAAALAKLGAAAAPAVKELGEALQDNQQDVRISALVALEAIGAEAKPAIPQIHKSLRERDKETRLAAVSAVGGIRAEDHDTIKCLIDLLEEKEYRAAVNDALVRIGKGTVPTLVRELSNPKAPVRLGVVQALEQLGADAARAVPALIQRAQADTDAEVRTAAAKAAQTIQKKVTGR